MNEITGVQKEKRQEISLYIKMLPEQSLRWIIEAEDWTEGSFNPFAGSKMCLINHAAGTYVSQRPKIGDGRRAYVVDHKIPLAHSNRVGSAFDFLCIRQGLEATVEFCKEEAQKALDAKRVHDGDGQRKLQSSAETGTEEDIPGLIPNPDAEVVHAG